MKHLTHIRSIFLLCLIPLSAVHADISLPAIFSDHMVLQQDKAIPVWGWADPGDQIVVKVADQSQTATTGDDGRWTATLDALPTGRPVEMTVKGPANQITIHDILIGEVWLGSGQSNMAMTVSRAADFADEQQRSDLPQIRMFTEKSGGSNTPGKEGSGSWQICSPSTVGSFSATLFFFGREIHHTLDVPVGLINSSVGGTPIESWVDADAQHASKDLQPLFAAGKRAATGFDAVAEKAKYELALERYREAVIKAKADGKPAPAKPRDPVALRARKGNIGGLFNGKIHPLIPFTIRGAIWYQGEANSTPEKAQFYQYQLPLLITDWRKRWGYDFPFAWAQLPNYRGEGRDWPTVREGMLKTLALPNTGMGINIDIGETKDIHPKNKQDVGRRLSLWALGTVYGQDVSAVSGPLPDGHRIDGRSVVLRFKHAQGLKATGGPLTGFEISGDGETWLSADAIIDGERVIVSHSEIEKPVAVRYGWANDPKCNLFNAAGLPATPFRTGM